MTQQLLLKPLGLITQPNKLGTIPQGALALADQCYMRQPGTIENAYTYTQVSPGSLLANANGPAFVVPTDDKYAYYSYNNSIGSRFWAFVDFTNTSTWPFGGEFAFSDELGLAQTIDVTGRYGTTINRNRLLVTGANGTYVYDIPTHSTTRSAGMPQPAVINVDGSSVVGLALPPNTHCMYTAVFVRRFSDGYELVSPPALAQEAANYSSTDTHSVQMTVWCGSGSGLDGYMQAGDILQIYRTKSQSYNSTTKVYTNTGSDYLLAIEYTLKAADITADSVSLTDNCPDASLGEALYTNQGVKTADGVALPAPTAKVITTFKGYTFYMNRKDPPKFTLRSPVWWGQMLDGATGVDATTRATGIGERSFKANSTSGSAVLSSISAADIVGIKVGQQLSFGAVGIPQFANVIAVGASSITLDANATSTTTATNFAVDDVIEVNGRKFPIGFPSRISQYIQSSSFDVGRIAFYCLNFVNSQPGAANLGPSAVPAQNVDCFYERLIDQIGSITIRATNGANWVPAFPKLELGETAKTFASTQVANGISWSEQNQPENVPPLNTAFCGSGEIYAAYATRDCIWIFCSDGLWRLSGTGGSAGAEGFDWRIDPVDSTLIIAGPQAGCVLRDMVFAYTNRGLVQVSSDGTIKELTLGRVDDRLPGAPFSAPTWVTSTALFLVADETNDEVWMRETITPGNRVWIYNYINDALTNDFVGIDQVSSGSGDAVLGGCYSRYLQATVFFNSTRRWLSSPNNATTRKRMDFKFQTLLGDDPFVTRMWQQVELAAYFPALGSCTVQLLANGDIRPPLTVNAGQACGARVIVSGVTTSEIDALMGRTSWSIPRNAPAISNTLGLEFFVSSVTVPVLVQGVAAKFVDLTEQRSRR